ncbi:hypothetical protein VDGL01_05684 [Verticillium dahliae]
MSGEPKFVGFEGIPYADNCLLRQAHVSVKPRSVANGARVGSLTILEPGRGKAREGDRQQETQGI